jgi:hypothetical protein
MHPNVIGVGKHEVSNATYFGSYATCNLNGFKVTLLETKTWVFKVFIVNKCYVR